MKKELMYLFAFLALAVYVTQTQYLEAASESTRSVPSPQISQEKQAEHFISNLPKELYGTLKFDDEEGIFVERSGLLFEELGTKEGSLLIEGNGFLLKSKSDFRKFAFNVSETGTVKLRWRDPSRIEQNATLTLSDSFEKDLSGSGHQNVVYRKKREPIGERP